MPRPTPRRHTGFQRPKPAARVDRKTEKHSSERLCSNAMKGLKGAMR